MNFYFIVFFILSGLDSAFAEPVLCRKIFSTQSNKVDTRGSTEITNKDNSGISQNSFSDLLKNQDWRAAYKILELEKRTVTEKMKHLPPDELAQIKKHWAGSDTGAVIATPIHELAEVSKQIGFRNGQKLIDIGSGHGDPGIVFGALNPGLKITGYELVGAKVDGANSVAAKLGLKNVHFVKQDLSQENFKLPEADYYYLFNPVMPEIVTSLAQQIKEISKTKDVRVIVYGSGWTHDRLKKLSFRPTASLSERTVVYQYKPIFEPKRSMEQLAQIYFSFKSKSQERYNDYAEKLAAKYPDYWRNSQTEQFRSGIKRFFDREKKYLDTVTKLILERPSEERIGFLRGLSKDQLIELGELLDTYLGLDIVRMDRDIDLTLKEDREFKDNRYGNEKIWYAPRAGQQTPWRDVFEVVDSMNLQSGQTVTDLGSGVGRLGLAIGLLRPDVNFVGLELVGPRVAYANAAARGNGFSNVKFVEANLADSSVELPQADHIYMFNPTNRATSEILTGRLVELSKVKNFKVYLLTGFDSPSFERNFLRTSRGSVGIYERRISP